MNWGNKITLVFIGFVILTITMVIFSMKQEFHMVEENYYEEEIAYQTKMDEIRNGNDWKGVISVKQEGSNLALQFEGAEKVNGKIQFYRPSDADLDFLFRSARKSIFPLKNSRPEIGKYPSIGKLMKRNILKKNKFSFSDK